MLFQAIIKPELKFKSDVEITIGSKIPNQVVHDPPNFIMLVEAITGAICNARKDLHNLLPARPPLQAQYYIVALDTDPCHSPR